MRYYLDKYGYLYSQLVKRDFNKKYKRSVLGIFWSVLSPLLSFLVMVMVFTHFFGRTTPYYNVYLFTGQIVYGYFTEATNSGMNSFMSGASLFSKLRVPKLIFMATSNSLAFINFSLTFLVLLLFIFKDGLLSWHLILLLYPLGCMTLFNVGTGLILGTMYVFFKDIQYLYSVLTRLLMYVSAIFYSIDTYPEHIQSLFYLNPLYVYIAYFREIIIEHSIPSTHMHLLCGFYGLFLFGLGLLTYRQFNKKFIYYV